VDGRETASAIRPPWYNPFRRLLEEMTPTVLELDSRFGTSGRTGPNFSRINRDIRFAKDKTLYKTQNVLEVFRSRRPG